MAICQCGRLHVTYGAITPHFEPRDFLHLAYDVGRMKACVRSRTTEEPHRVVVEQRP